jgi:hypothetical protein
LLCLIHTSIVWINFLWNVMLTFLLKTSLAKNVFVGKYYLINLVAKPKFEYIFDGFSSKHQPPHIWIHSVDFPRIAFIWCHCIIYIYIRPPLVILILKFIFLNQFSLKIQIKYSLGVYYVFYFIHQRVYYNTNRASHKIKNKMKNRASHM